MDHFKAYLDYFFLTYGVALFTCYFLFVILAIIAIRKNKKAASFLNIDYIKGAKELPSISLVAPAFNEAKTIVINIQSLLSIDYPFYNLILVNDGSKDDTMEKLIHQFDLVLTQDIIPSLSLSTAVVRGIYISSNPLYKKLTVIDKENGGRADALNCGIANSKTDLVLCTDADCIIEQDALLKLVRPYLESTEKEVIATGAAIGIANDSIIENGTLHTLKVPKSIIARIQIVEYIRAFLLGRMAWGYIDGLFLVSGAFGLYPRNRVIEVGGFDKDTVGEDLELCIRLRVYMERQKLPYDIVYIPETLCWTEAPASAKVYITQRDRWSRGLYETLKKHRYLFYNPKFGLTGLAFFPYWVYFELLAPVVEFIGILLIVTYLIMGTINYPFALWLLFLFYIIGVLFSVMSILIYTFNFKEYATFSKTSKLVLASMVEPFITHPIMLYAEIKGYFKKLFGIKSNWGTMSRKGFTTKD